MINFQSHFDEKRQDQEWRNRVAKELNLLLKVDGFSCDIPSGMEATLSIVRRVSDFEKIKTVEQIDNEQRKK